MYLVVQLFTPERGSPCNMSVVFDTAIGIFDFAGADQSAHSRVNGVDGML